MNDFKSVCGIDTMYYFCITNENYDNLFLEILDQIETQESTYARRGIDRQKNDIGFMLKEKFLFKYLGKSGGFYWLREYRSFFKIGFKDPTKNKGLNDIYVQLEAKGIYTLGMATLLAYVNDELLGEYTQTDTHPLTRIDINCFVNHDFSFLTREMFVTRKRVYKTVCEIGSAHQIQTLYIGKKPYMLRIYNKKEELKNSDKKEMMYEYFANHGLDLEQPIYNIEFEMHRDHLKYETNLVTVETALILVKLLFQVAMDDFRLIDLGSISESQKIHNKYKASTLPIWDTIKMNFAYNEFHQSAIPIERIKRKISYYEENQFEKDSIALYRKAIINNIPIDEDSVVSTYKKAKHSFTKSTSKPYEKGYVDIKIDYPNKPSEKRRYIKSSKEIIQPINTIPLSQLGDYDLEVHYERAEKDKDNSKFRNDIYFVAKKEMTKRGLLPNEEGLL